MNKMTIGQKIKQLRENLGISQPELAKKIGVSKGTISFWENDINEPKASYIISLAKYFNVSADFLLGINKEINNKERIQKPEILAIYNTLTRPHKNMLLGFAKELLKTDIYKDLNFEITNELEINN